MRHCNVSLIEWAKSQDSVHKPPFLKRKESRSGSNRGPSAYQPSALPLGHTGPHPVTLPLAILNTRPERTRIQRAFLPQCKVYIHTLFLFSPGHSRRSSVTGRIEPRAHTARISRWRMEVRLRPRGHLVLSLYKVL